MYLNYRAEKLEDSETEGGFFVKQRSGTFLRTSGSILAFFGRPSVGSSVGWYSMYRCGDKAAWDKYVRNHYLFWFLKMA